MALDTGLSVSPDWFQTVLIVENTMKRLLAIVFLISSASFAHADTFSLPRLLDPLGLFQTSAHGLLGDRSVEGAPYPYADGTRGGGKFLRAPSTYRGGGKKTKLIGD
ncbi:MAG: hypothetical protein IPK23_15770 [Rhizobiales bacterium]|nr:hypothetical protein [Hyphomicrobiales bacterium]